MPNWQFDAICLGAELAAEVAARFPSVRLFPVARAGGSTEPMAAQIVPCVTGGDWFDARELRDRALARHGAAGAARPECEVWRWYPLPLAELPPIRVELPSEALVAASPEWFGDGWQAFRQLALRRPLAELISSASPRDVSVRPLT